MHLDSLVGFQKIPWGEAQHDNTVIHKGNRVGLEIQPKL